MVRSTLSLSLGHSGRLQVEWDDRQQKRASKGPWAAHRQASWVDYPPAAVRFDTRISEVAKVRTDVPFVLRGNLYALRQRRSSQLRPESGAAVPGILQTCV